MTVINAPITDLMSRGVRSRPSGTVSTGEELSRPIDATKLTWERCLMIFADWWRNPEQLDDAEIEPPSREVIERAVEVTRGMRDRFPSEPPTTVIPDRDGGIIIERRESNTTTAVQIYDDLRVEMLFFKDDRLVDRFPVELD